MITGLEVPLEAAGAASLVAFALGAFVARRQFGRGQAPAADSLAGLFSGRAFRNAVDAANRRTAGRTAGQAVLHGRIDQLATLRAGWDAETREQVLGHIAAVMKAGVRRDDSFARIEGDGFRIVMSEADERAARSVAERLRAKLAQVKLPQFGQNSRFTASFGIAAGAPEDSGEGLVARARAALMAAQQAGADHVIAASEIEEVMFLPPPDKPAAAA